MYKARHQLAGGGPRGRAAPPASIFPHFRLMFPIFLNFLAGHILNFDISHAFNWSLLHMDVSILSLGQEDSWYPRVSDFSWLENCVNVL